jgi:hypothetical protein
MHQRPPCAATADDCTYTTGAPRRAIAVHATLHPLEPRASPMMQLFTTAPQCAPIQVIHPAIHPYQAAGGVMAYSREGWRDARGNQHASPSLDACRVAALMQPLQTQRAPLARSIAAQSAAAGMAAAWREASCDHPAAHNYSAAQADLLATMFAVKPCASAVLTPESCACTGRQQRTCHRPGRSRHTLALCHSRTISSKSSYITIGNNAAAESEGACPVSASCMTAGSERDS